MKVLHFNASIKGGAAIAAHRIFEAIAPKVDEAYFYSAGDVGKDLYELMPAFKGHKSIADRIKWSLFYRHLSKATAGKQNMYEKFTPASLPINTPLPLQHGIPDIIHLHWTSEMIDYASFFASVPDDIPIVWTCHDMNPFTGGCHYTWGCNKFEKECGTCPQLNVSGPNDLSAKTQAIKVNALKGKQLHVVGNSYWIEEQSRKSKVFAGAISYQTIHNPVETNLFVPLDKVKAKEILGLPDGAQVIAFGAERFTNERKGFALLIEALKEVKRKVPNAYCLVFGGGNGLETNDDLPPIKYMGFVDSVWLQRIVHSAADVFVIPSRQEAFGLTALEAMACATPVVGFDTGGIGDMITNEKTGLLAEVDNKSALANGIIRLLQQDELRKRLGANARVLAAEQFNMERQGALYFDLYNKAIAHSKGEL